ncbi:hypothetical protein PS720_05085 [Pseudomonas fluorescens]|nr:hypothetical protein PS720_05085 [Pseudomonas fluorescens]
MGVLLGQASCPSASGQQQTGIRQPLAVGELQAMVFRLQLGHRVTGDMLDTQLRQPRAVAQAAPGQVRRALQHSLGQRWSLVGQVRLIADQDQAPGVTFFAQGQRRTATGMAGADDDQGCAHGHAVTASNTRPASTRTG